MRRANATINLPPLLRDRPVGPIPPQPYFATDWEPPNPCRLQGSCKPNRYVLSTTKIWTSVGKRARRVKCTHREGRPSCSPGMACPDLQVRQRTSQRCTWLNQLLAVARRSVQQPPATGGGLPRHYAFDAPVPSDAPGGGGQMIQSATAARLAGASEEVAHTLLGVTVAVGIALVVVLAAIAVRGRSSEAARERTREASGRTSQAPASNCPLPSPATSAPSAPSAPSSLGAPVASGMSAAPVPPAGPANGSVAPQGGASPAPVEGSR